MIKRLAFVFVFLMTATTLFAGDPDRRVVIVRDGQVLLDEGSPLIGTRGYIGISLTQLTPELREYFGAPKDTGVLVSSLADNGPAEKAGVHVGDVIVAVNGKTVAGTRELTHAMRDVKKGESVRIEVIRGKARQTIVATADEREMPEMLRALDLADLGQNLGSLSSLGGPGWHTRIAAPEDIDALRARIRELEMRMKELQKRLDQK